MSLFGSITDFLSGGNQSAAANASQASVDALASLQTPDVTQMQLQLETLVQQGILSPEQAQVYMQDPSLMAGISTDPRLQQAQYDALQSLQDISDSGGLTASDRAKLGQIATDEQTQARGAREAILQNMEARGAGGSGASLLAQLQNSQDAASRQSQRDLDVAGMAQDRALQAIQAAGAMGGQMQQTSFNQQAEQAKAQDAINAFNAQNMNQIGLANTQANNAAQQANLAEKQRIADANAATRNTQQQYNKSLAQQDFENRYKKAGGTAAAYQNQAQQFNTAGQQNMNLVGSGIQAGATAAAAASDERVKEDIQPFDASSFLDSLTASKYKYKNPGKHGEGQFAGVMAQDLEKTPEGSSLVHPAEDGTKMVDTSKAAMAALASLADMNDRVKALEGTEEDEE